MLSGRTICAAGGVALFAMATALSVWSQFLSERAWHSVRLLHIFVWLNVTAAIIYVVVVARLRHWLPSRVGFTAMLLVGLAMRMVLLPSAPVLDTDSFRYFWDGALTARGLTPYLHTPEEGRAAIGDDDADRRVQAVAREAGAILQSINHPEVRTIYPPVAQGAFLLAYWIDPWSGTAWRAVLLMADVATVALLWALLRRLDLPRQWLVIYWWNPLVVKEFYCGGHLDALVLPLVLGALLLAMKDQLTASAICLAAAVATKLWPVILLPLLLRSAFREPRRIIGALSAFTLATAVLFAPMFISRAGFAGMQAYARSWQANDGVFQFIMLFWRQLGWMLALPWSFVEAAARGTAAALVLAWVAWLARKPLSDRLALCNACLLAVAGLFLLSPTQYPWYYTWLVPLLALRPRWSLLLYTALLPLYHLSYHAHAWVWVEHVPVWGLLALEFFSRRQRVADTEPNSQLEFPIDARALAATTIR